MSRNGSIKEYLFNLILYVHQSTLLTPFIGESRDLQLEQYQEGNKKIDVYGMTVSNRPFFIESQLGKSDENHLQKVKLLLNAKADTGGYVLWIASGFKEEHIEELNSFFEKYHDKQIMLLVISINRMYLQTLNGLNRLKHFEIWEEINKENFLLPDLSKSKVWGMKSSTVPSISRKHSPLSTIEGLNEYFISFVQAQVPCFLNVHRAKPRSNHDVVFGSGKADLSIVVNLQKKIIKFRLQGIKHKSIFEEIRQVTADSNEYLSHKKSEELIFQILDTNEPLELVKSAVEVFEMLVSKIIPITYK